MDESIVLDEELLRNKNPKLISDIEGELEINIDSAVFFKEKNSLLLEFAINHNDWMMLNRCKENINFIYDTMDHDEPVIKFIKKVMQITGE
ncbi:DUF7878 domain-containing protein [Haloplasma contractile]|uniref:DUF7878 domain-containing protein n=1 Tax=Haloplasma contractile SSD-17B TaxID=1033810 RepID=U2FIL6_9MOLU|nr:hypothetical protein [Haloplasma contractile]ERJ11074.1 hypothetical protein HLPCO_002895 [Haloplasma contractile SSD-17B]